MKKKMITFLIFLIAAAFFVTWFFLSGSVNAATIIDVEEGTTKEETVETAETSNGGSAKLSAEDDLEYEDDGGDTSVEASNSTGSSTAGSGDTSITMDNTSVYIDDNGNLNVASTENSTKGFFTNLYGKLLEGLNSVQIIAILLVMIIAVITCILLVINIIGDHKKIPFYIGSLVICAIVIVFIFYAPDIFASFVIWAKS